VARNVASEDESFQQGAVAVEALKAGGRLMTEGIHIAAGESVQGRRRGSP
jgi:hypothetical protein